MSPLPSEPSEANDRLHHLFSEFLNVRGKEGHVCASPGEDLVCPQDREEQWGLRSWIPCLGMVLY